MPKFLLSIHDVEPNSMWEVSEILKELKPLVGSRVTAAVIPAPWQRCSDQQATSSLIARVCDGVDEILLHGFEHRRRKTRNPVSFLLNKSDEFRGISSDEAKEKLFEGKRVITDLFGHNSNGFAPPAWFSGPVDEAMLSSINLEFMTNYFHIQQVDGRKRPVATYSWDCGRYSFLGYLGEMSGRVVSLNSNAIPQIVFHPADVQRGFIAFGIRRIKKLLEQGYSSTSYHEIVCDGANELT